MKSHVDVSIISHLVNFQELRETANNRLNNYVVHLGITQNMWMQSTSKVRSIKSTPYPKMFSLSKNGPKDTQENLKLKRKLEDIPFFKKINIHLYLVQLSFLWYRYSLLKIYDHLKFNYLTKARADDGSIPILSMISLALMHTTEI
ncbi:MAG: hypothetical protein ACFFA0_07405 [Promethearchaeota archaeon]